MKVFIFNYCLLSLPPLPAVVKWVNATPVFIGNECKEMEYLIFFIVKYFESSLISVRKHRGEKIWMKIHQVVIPV